MIRFERRVDNSLVEPARTTVDVALAHVANVMRGPHEIGPVRSKMERQTTVVLYFVLMAATIIAVDFLFFRNRFWERLIVNIGIVLVFAAFYFRLLKHP